MLPATVLAGPANAFTPPRTLAQGRYPGGVSAGETPGGDAPAVLAPGPGAPP